MSLALYKALSRNAKSIKNSVKITSPDTNLSSEKTDRLCQSKPCPLCQARIEKTAHHERATIYLDGLAKTGVDETQISTVLACTVCTEIQPVDENYVDLTNPEQT